MLATQNPIEQEGTYPLPEAQLDRFMFNIWVDYPEYADELEVVKRTTGGESASVNPVLSGDEIATFQQHIRKMPVADNVVEYAVKLAAKTRPGREHAPDQVNQYLSWGAGPRASQYLIVAAKCHAAFAGKYSPDIENVRAVALPILRHRIVRNYKAEAEGITVERLVESWFDYDHRLLSVSQWSGHISEISSSLTSQGEGTITVSIVSIPNRAAHKLNVLLDIINFEQHDISNKSSYRPEFEDISAPHSSARAATIKSFGESVKILIRSPFKRIFRIAPSK